MFVSPGHRCIPVPSECGRCVLRRTGSSVIPIVMRWRGSQKGCLVNPSSDMLLQSYHKMHNVLCTVLARPIFSPHLDGFVCLVSRQPGHAAVLPPGQLCCDPALGIAGSALGPTAFSVANVRRRTYSQMSLTSSHYFCTTPRPIFSLLIFFFRTLIPQCISNLLLTGERRNPPK